MSSWLASLPHQIPFRAAASARRVDERTMEGRFLCSVGDALGEGVAVNIVLVEAMAQIGGELAFGDSSEPGFLSAIDNVRIDGPIEAGEAFDITVTLDADFSGVYRFTGTARIGEVERASARFYLTTVRPD